MKIFSQGLVNASERFFHSLYTSAAGDQFLNGDPLRDSPPSPLGLDPTTEFIFGIAIGLLILFVFFYMTRNIILKKDLDTSSLPILS